MIIGSGSASFEILRRIRGWLDRQAGGPGLRRGRRHPDSVRYGDDAVVPFHGVVFRTMLAGIRRDALDLAAVSIQPK